MSSAEAEYISAADAAKEITWTINLLCDLDLSQQPPITLYSDNQSCIKLASSDKYHQKTKHIDLRFHLLKDLTEKGTIKMEYKESEHMTADILTKVLPKKTFEKHRNTFLTHLDVQQF